MMHQKGLHETVTFILEVRGLKVVTRIKISQNAVADSNVSVTISPSMIIQALVCLARRKRIFPKAPWLLMINRSFVSFAASQLTSYMWSTSEKNDQPWMHQSAHRLHVDNCCTSSLLMSHDYIGPVCIYLPSTYLDILLLEGWFYIFQRKDRAKRISSENFPDLKTPVLHPF